MNNSEAQERFELIVKYILPALPSELSDDPGFLPQLVTSSHLVYVPKHKKIEVPGNFDDGKVWFAIDAMVHSFYFCPDTLTEKGTRIWKKREFMFFSDGLFGHQYRTDYLETLEEGRLIYISYINIIELKNNYPALENQLRLLSLQNERYYHNRSLMLNKKPVERVRQLIKENPLFITISSKSTQAMHVNLTRNGYSNQLKKL